MTSTCSRRWFERYSAALYYLKLALKSYLPKWNKIRPIWKTLKVGNNQYAEILNSELKFCSEMDRFRRGWWGAAWWFRSIHLTGKRGNFNRSGGIQCGALKRLDLQKVVHRWNSILLGRNPIETTSSIHRRTLPLAYPPYVTSKANLTPKEMERIS